MSGYLQRLVHTALHERSTVHPRTGSIFAPYPSATDSGSEWFEQAEEVRADPARSGSSTGSESASDDWQPLFEPLRPGDEPKPARDEARQMLETEIELPHPLVAPQAQRRAADTKRGAGIQTYVPLLPPRPSEGDSAGPKTSRFAVEGIRAGAASPSLRVPDGRAMHAERTPDEIQIHIGRIEVTAVPPVASRAPKPPDHSISLDAYLDGRNGKAR